DCLKRPVIATDSALGCSVARVNQTSRNVSTGGSVRRPPLSSRAMQNILPILIADGPEALTELCGVNLLERLLRILQRLGFQRAIVFSTRAEIVRAELTKRSWPRE